MLVAASASFGNARATVEAAVATAAEVVKSRRLVSGASELSNWGLLFREIEGRIELKRGT